MTRSWTRIAVVAALAALAGCDLVFDLRPPSDLSDAPSSDAPSGPLLHLRFDGPNLVDDDAGHPVACVGGCPTLVAGVIGGAAHFSGAQCLAIGDTGDLDPAAFTFGFWVSLQLQASKLFSRPLDGEASDANTFETLVDSQGFVVVQSGSAVNGGMIEGNSWHHIAATYADGVLRVFIDGVLGGQESTTFPGYGPDSLLLGCDRDNGLATFFAVGDFDELVLFPRALSAAEIAGLATR